MARARKKTRTKRSKKVNRFGYLDANGQIAIAPRFDEATSFVNGLAQARWGTLWGYIDPSGAWAIPPRFTSTTSFELPFAFVTIGRGLAQYSIWIDRHGNERFAAVRPVSSGSDEIFCVNVGGNANAISRSCTGGQYALVDAHGEELAPPLPESLYYGAVVEDRVVVIHPEYCVMHDFAGREIGERIDAEGTHPHVDGRIVFRLRSGKHGALDDHGGLALPPDFRFLSDFSEGVAFAWLEGARCAIVDRDGAPLVDLEIHADSVSAHPFSNGHARVSRRLSGKTEGNFVRRDGTWLLDEWVTYLPDDFVEGLARVDRTVVGVQRTGLIDTFGRFLVDSPDVTSLQAHEPGWGIVARHQATGWGLLDGEGQWALPPRFNRLGDFHGDRAIASLHGDPKPVGLLARNGEWIWEPQWSHIRAGENDTYTVARGGSGGRKGSEVSWKGGTWKVLRLDGESIAELGGCPAGAGPLQEGRLLFSTALTDADTPTEIIAISSKTLQPLEELVTRAADAADLEQLWEATFGENGGPLLTESQWDILRTAAAGRFADASASLIADTVRDWIAEEVLSPFLDLTATHRSTDNTQLVLAALQQALLRKNITIEIDGTPVARPPSRD